MKTKAAPAQKRAVAGLEEPSSARGNKRRSVELAPASRGSMDSGRSSYSHNDAYEPQNSPPSSSSLAQRLPSEHPPAPAATATGAQPCIGVPVADGAASQRAAASEAPAKKRTSAPAIGVPLAMPSGFGLPFPFLPPPLLFFWMQQLAVQQSMAYMQQQQLMLQQPIAPSNTGAHASPPPPAPRAPWPMPPAPPPSIGNASLFGSADSLSANTMMPPPPVLPYSAMPTAMPAFPPPPPPLAPLLPHMELPPPPPVPAELVDEGAPLQKQELRPAAEEEEALLQRSKLSAEDAADGAHKVDGGSSDSSDGDSGCADTDFAAFIDSFLAGPDTGPGSGPQADLSHPDAGPPLSLLLCKSEAEDVLELLRSSSTEEAHAAACSR